MQVLGAANPGFAVFFSQLVKSTKFWPHWRSAAFGRAAPCLLELAMLYPEEFDVIVVGGGVIGLELGSVYAILGTEVHVV